jgi:alkyl hydroperoxide reductase subunit F
MAEGYLRARYGDRYEAFSAGSVATHVHPLAILAMDEIGIDISGQRSKNLEEYVGTEMDVAVTVCDPAQGACPVFPWAVETVNSGFPDPAAAEGTEKERLAVFRTVRDQIVAWIDTAFGAPEAWSEQTQRPVVTPSSRPSAPMPGVAVYYTETCPFCRMVKAFLDSHGVTYRGIEVGHDREAAQEMFERTGQFVVPVTTVDGEVIPGFDAVRLSALFGEKTEGEMEEVDVLIIGGGPAGLTAGVYGARKGLKTLLLTKTIGGQALESWAIENYMGYRMIRGEELMQKFEEQLRDQDLRLEFDRVIAIEREGERFRAKTEGGRSVLATAVVVASGRDPRELGAPGEEIFRGRGISPCATCDAPLYRGKRVGVVGGGNSAVTTAIELAGVAAHVDLIVRSDLKADEALRSRLTENENVTIRQGYGIVRFEGDAVLAGITVRDRASGQEERLAVDGVFVEIGWIPSTGFLGDLIELDAEGRVVVDRDCRTTTPGIYAAGDVTNVRWDQIIIAAGEGAKAALEAHAWVAARGGTAAGRTQ